MRFDDGTGNICQCRSPSHRMSCNSSTEGSKCISMTKRATSARGPTSDADGGGGTPVNSPIVSFASPSLSVSRFLSPDRRFTACVNFWWLA